MATSTAAADRDYDDPAPFIRSGAAGEVIFKEGDTEFDLFIVQDGRVELLRDQAATRVGIAGEGDLVGEWSFFEQQPRDVTARGLTDFTLIRLDRPAFERIIGEAPEAAVRMLQKVARALHDRRLVAAPAPARRGGSGKYAAAAKSAPKGDAVLVEETSGTRFVLSAAESLVGRIDRASGFTPEVNLAPLDSEKTLSRRHARIVKREGDYIVREDKSSRNGTFVNGKRLNAGVDVALRDGDEIRFGLVKTIFRWR
jgi:hypothetical protein